MVDLDEWLISEKNYWGIPIPYFIHKQTHEVLCNPEIALHAAEVFKEHGGSDAWYSMSVKDLLPQEYKSESENYWKGDEVFNFQSSYDIELNPELPVQRGRRSQSKALQIEKQKQELIQQQLIKTKNQYKNTDFDTFRKLMPKDKIWTDKSIQKIVDEKIKANEGAVQDYYNSNTLMACESYEQHEGWFLTSVMASIGLTRKAPFNIMKTHGIITNIGLNPKEIIDGTEKLENERSYGFGAEVLRVWAAIHDTDDSASIENAELQHIHKEIKVLA